MLLPVIGGSYETLRPLMSEVLQQFAKRWLPPGTSLSRTGAGRSDGLGAFPAAGRLCRASGSWYAPSTCTWPAASCSRQAFWGATGRISPRFLIRPDLPYSSASLCWRLPPAAPSGSSASAFTGAFVGAYLLGGLALTHFIARWRAPWLTWLVYLGLLFLWPFFMPLVVLAGLLDSTLTLKQRFGLSPPST